MLTLEDILRVARLRIDGNERRSFQNYPETNRHGETIFYLGWEKDHFLPTFISKASCWKPPEERSAYDSCPWPRS